VRIYVADVNETLRIVADKCNVTLEELIQLNPEIEHPDVLLDGFPIKLPNEIVGNEDILDIPFCPLAVYEYADDWIPTISPEKMAETEYDVLIVGSGAGGAAALWRLSQQLGPDKRIGVIEAGETLLPTHPQNISASNEERLQQFSLNPDYMHRYEEALDNPMPTDFKQFFSLGGRALIWGTVCPRMDQVDLAQWPVSSDEMNKYYHIAEEVMQVNPFYTKGSTLQNVLLKRLQQTRFPNATDLPMAVDLRTSRYGIIFSNVFFNAIIFFALAMNTRPIDVAVNTRAVKVLFEGDQMSGVQVMSSDKRSYNIKAKTVILSASTFETPRILLNSGINRKPIGHYLTNQSSVFAIGRITRSNFPETLGNLALWIPRTKSRPYQIKIKGPGDYFWYQDEVMPLRESWEISFLSSGFVESRFVNKIELHPWKKDAYGVPELRVHFSYSKQDKRVIKQMEEAILHASAILSIPIAANRICIKEPGAENHDMGTCRMGNDPATSATNPFGQVHDISGLYIADSSVIPTSGAADPALTVIALAIRTADYIANQLKS
jgi:choline dehydrogenase-like flavoprotein